jgi:hypothetical protein
MNHSSSFRLRINSDYLAAAAVTLAPLCYFFRAVLGQRVISPDDGIIFNIPLRVAAANIMRAGYLPLWNPYIFSGMPLHGAAQAGLLFPPNWSYLVFSAPVATNVMMLATYRLAALGAYLYARRSGSLITGAIVTSLAWQWSSFLITHIGHTNILQTAAMLPWILWALDGYGMSDTGDKRRRRGVLLALLVAVQCFTGHQQTFAYSLMLAAVYAIVMAHRPHRSPERKTGYYRALVFVAAGILLSAVQIVPTFELLRNSPRASISYSYFTAFSMPPRFVLTLLAPYLMGGGDGLIFRAPYVGPAFYGEYAAYVGVTSVMLALVALLVRPDKLTKFWAIVVAVGLVLALGRFAPFGLYKAIYFVPVLNLFRVPARHLMEVDFALAVLAGRGVSTLITARLDFRAWRRVKIVGIAVIALTLLTVTLGRPANFTLARDAPVSFLRAPELFLPVVFALLGAWSVWRFARGRRGATVLLLSVLVVDLAVGGQSRGWRVASAPRDFELWGEPDTVRFLRQRAADEGGQPYRILTQDQPFDPSVPSAPPAGGAWVATLQPDVYMMYGIENAAGYDGFGLERYSRLAGDMKVWGELPDPERTLRGESRELDLLNVRYLLVRSSAAPVNGPVTEGSALPLAMKVYGGEPFGEENLNVSSIGAGERLLFSLPPTAADHVALLTNLTWADTVKDREIVARVHLHAQDGETFNIEVRAGEHTSDWAYDRPDIRSRIKHRRALIGTSYEVEDPQARYEAHTYVCSFALPRNAIIDGGEITVPRIAEAPELTLSLSRLTLLHGNRAIALRSELVKKESVANREAPLSRVGEQENWTGPRWQRVAEFGKVAVFENTRKLPRAWLANSKLVGTDEEELNIIRSGKMPNGAAWNPLEQALVISNNRFSLANANGPTGNAKVTRREPNRIEVKTESTAPAILVLSENHYPGWRAFVDGQSVEVMRVNYNQRGLVLPAGNHLVIFVYRPWSVLIGLLVSLLTLAGLLLWPRKI